VTSGAGVRAGDSTAAPRLLTAFEAPGFRAFYLSGICWFWGRWGTAFLAAYYINQATDSPRLVQLTGTSIWGPMLLGGVAGGVIADRYHRVKIVRLQLFVMIPATALIGVLEVTERLEPWMVYPVLIVAGFAWVVDMTSRRSLLMDIVGPTRLDNAVALESTSQASGMVVGNLLGGVMVAALGVGEGFLVLSALFAAAFLMFLNVPKSFGQANKQGAIRPLTQLKEGFALLRTNRGLLSILGVTMIANLFFFAYFPAIQRVGDKLDISAGQVGLLAASTGFGMMTAALLIAALRPRRNGVFYVVGISFAMLMLVPFALATSLPMAMGALYIASVGSGMFGATQSVLVLNLVDPAVRGRAMGLLGMAIGALPVGSTMLGELAERWGVSTAIVVMTLSGFALLMMWVSTHRDVIFMTTTGGR
jgi:predicted MFS family arabinose efflux permease